MKITDVRIRKILNERRICAVISITLDNALVVHDIKLVKGDERMFVSMPSRKDEEGNFRDIVHPINLETRKLIEDTIIDAYHEHLASESNAPRNNLARDFDAMPDYAADELGEPVLV
ncbi:MAG: septation regulator SpoVG [Oscillospiraceae bacterium]|nr:septation regulator SpoVG [Oscillospiraceae bacterium]